MKPKPCPFCGAVACCVVLQPNPIRHYVLCMNVRCGARGPRRLQPEKACEVWNAAPREGV